MKTPVLALVFTCAGLALGTPDEGRPTSQGNERRAAKPSRFIKLDVVDAGFIAFQGPDYGSGQGGVLLKATYQLNRFRFGAAATEFWGDIADGPAGPVPVPMGPSVYAGFTIWHNPKKTSFFYGAVPDVYAEVGASIPYRKPILKAALACDLDYYGIGLRAETGGYLNPWHGNTLYFALQLRLLTFGIAL